MPQRNILSIPAASAVRNIEPTLYALLILSRISERDIIVVNMTYTQENAKTILFGLLSVLSIVLIVALFSTMGFLRSAGASSSTVTFTGEGKVSAKPDIATVDFSIVTEATTSTDAQNQNSSKSKSVEDFLKKQGIEDKDIKTTAYNIYPQYYYPANGPQRFSGYQVSQSYHVKIRDFTKASAVVDGLVKAGVNQVNNLEFEIEDPDRLQADARAMAIEDAKSKADELKGEVGIKLGKIVSFSENTGGYPIYAYDYAEAGRGGGGSGPALPTGENEITVSVSITYQIK